MEAGTAPLGATRTAGVAVAGVLAVLAVAAVGLWLVSVGAGWLSFVLAGASGLAIAWCGQSRLDAGRALTWIVAVVYAAAIAFPGAALAGDLVLHARGHAEQATVQRFGEIEGAHSASGYTVLRLGPAFVPPGTVPAEVRISRTDGLSPGQRVQVLIDPSGHVAPSLVDDVRPTPDAVLFGGGLGLTALALVWWIVARERDRRRDQRFHRQESRA